MTGAAMVQKCLVWDQLFPVTEACGRFHDHAALLARMAAAGVNAVSLTMAYDPEDTMAAVRRIVAWRNLIDGDPARFRLIRQADDVLEARAAGQLAIGLHLQGSTPFATDPGLVPLFYDLGIRAAILVYNKTSAVGGGAHEAPDPGLSEYGRALVAAMHRSAMMVDCSHTGERTARDALALGSGPIFYTHANARAVDDHPRNIPDDLAQEIVASGGMVGVCGVSLFLSGPERMVERLFAHIDHWCSLLGAENVGLGLDIVSDMEATKAALAREAAKWPADAGYQAGDLACVDPEDLPTLVDRMLAAGYGEDTISGILGQNWLAAARRVWR
ncbi:MAG: membrane dipeptidase [Pseudomonadota bacterium]